MNPFAVIVLAAGESRRMGTAKQLLPLRGATLVEHSVQTALASGATQVVVVLGARAEVVRAPLQGFGVTIVENHDWQTGMGSSIACGVGSLGRDVETAVVALVDQPGITPEHLRFLAQRAHPTAASLYEGILGAPCAFARSEFPRLLALTGDQGARHLLRSGEIPVEAVPFEGALLDLDTPESYEAFLRKESP